MQPRPAPSGAAEAGHGYRSPRPGAAAWPGLRGRDRRDRRGATTAASARLAMDLVCLAVLASCAATEGQRQQQQVFLVSALRRKAGAE